MKEAETAADRRCLLIGCIALILMTVLLLILWNRIPERIPKHYDFAGTITSWGNRNTILVFPVAGWSLHIVMVIVSRHPKIWNTGTVEITRENALPVYRILYHMLSSMTLIMDLMFLYLAMQTIYYTLLPAWGVNLFVAALIIDLVVSLVRVKRM